MEAETFNSLGELRIAEQRALWDNRFAYANLLRRLYLLSYCHANGLPLDTGDY